MLSKKKNRSKKVDAKTENKIKNDENKNKKVSLEIPLKEENEDNIKTKKINKENPKKKNVRGSRKTETNNASIHNNEVKNSNSENKNDYQSIGNQNNNNITETDHKNNHTSVTNTQKIKEGNNINKGQNQNNKTIARIYVTPNPEDYESDNENNTQTNQNEVQNFTQNKLDSRKNSKNISIKPINCDIFNKIDLFNSVLLIINNISFIKNYFSNDEAINLIKKCEKNNKYCLSSISYYISKYFWYENNKEKKSQNDLLNAYKDFVQAYSKENCKDNNPDLYCFNINNIENIINFIYNRINVELTNSKGKKKDSPTQFNGLIYKYLDEFQKKNSSIISDHFIGHYLNKVFCNRCSNAQFSYEPFRTISFNVKRIYDNFYNKRFQLFYNMLNYNNINNYNIANNNNIRLNDCFNYLFNNDYNFNYNYNNTFCENCNFLTNKKQSFSIFSLPNIITIVLNDNNDNDIFMLEDEIDLKNYVLNSTGNEKYNLISFLCRVRYNGKFIIYCINPNNSMWYSYTDGNITEVDKMDINAIPLMLVYQIQSQFDFFYKPIKREPNKIKFCISFSNGITGTSIHFDKNESFKDLHEKISSYFNLKDKEFILIINSKTITEGQKLNEFINFKNNCMLVYFNK